MVNYVSSVSWGSYFDHALTWDKRLDDPNVMIVTYEELKQVEQPVCVVFAMSQFCILGKSMYILQRNEYGKPY